MDTIEEKTGVKLSWFAPEYEERERSADWFWALGVIAITSALTAIIFSNYFFAVLILLSGGLLYFFAKKSPEMIPYDLTEKGIRMRHHFYPYENLKAFYVQKENKPLLFIKTERFFLPVISIPIEESHVDEIQNIFLSKKVPEVEMKEHPAEKIMETFGF